MVTGINSDVPECTAPLLVLRVKDFERVAWRVGKHEAILLERRTTRAFKRAARAVMRSGDRVRHDPGSDVYTILMSARRRNERAAVAADYRAVLERLSHAVCRATGLAVETGWLTVSRSAADAELSAGIDAALVRGARERERYEFLAAAGHELRTPLTAIRGYLETLIDGEADPAAARRFLEVARREALRMGRLLDRMFEFSLLDLSASGVAMDSCDLGEQISAACEVMRPIVEKRGISLDCRAGPALPVALEADACLQLLVNLLDNAIKYGRPGGRVSVRARAVRSTAVIEVEDDGPGVRPAERGAVFGLRVRGTRPGVPGAGIGLAIVKTIAARAGGSVRCASSQLGGAKFQVRLPLRAESVGTAS